MSFGAPPRGPGYTSGSIDDAPRESTTCAEATGTDQTLREVLDHTPAGIVAADLSTHKLIFANTEFQRMVGYSWKQLIGQSPAMLHPKESLERVMHAFAEMAAGRLVETEGVPVRRSDGSVFTVSVHCRMTNFGSTKALLAVFFDTTERDAAQAVAREHLARMEAVLASHPDLIYILDAQGVILNAHRHRRQTGTQAPELVEGKALTEVLPREASEVVLRSLRSTLRTEMGTTCSYKVMQDGRTEYFETRLEPFPNKRVLAIVRRITDRRQLEAETLARKAAEQANRSKGEFLATVSHEIRTPLNAIIGFSRNVARSPLLDERLREQVSTIERSGEHLLTLISDMLDFARIEAGRMQLIETDFNLRLLLQDLCEMFRLRCANKGLAFTFESRGPIPEQVHGDRTKLQQVLVNLLGNAAKFTTTGGLILRVGRPVDRVAPEHILGFEVEDTGPGIPEADRPRLFDEYFQGELGRNAGGTGLGLPICKRLVSLMGGGPITVRTSCPGGSRFSFEIALPPAKEGTLIIASYESSEEVEPGAVLRAPGLREQECAVLSLPSQLRLNLGSAVLAGDTAAMGSLIAEASTLLPVAGALLARLAKSYHYEELLRLLDPTLPQS